MKLLLVRHGESEGNVAKVLQGQQEHPLSEHGLEQAESLSAYLEKNLKAPSHVYSSPLERAKATAQICTQGYSAEIQTDARLMEIHNGVLQGLTWAQAQEQYPEVCHELSNSPLWIPIPEAEIPEQAFQRVHQFIEQLFAHHNSTDQIWIFSHGGILQHFVARLLGCDRLWGISIPPTGLFEFELDLEQWATATQDRYTGHLFRILQFNATPHLGR